MTLNENQLKSSSRSVCVCVCGWHRKLKGQDFTLWQGVKSDNFVRLEFSWTDISGFQNYLVPVFKYFSEFHYKPIKVSIDLTIKNLGGALFFLLYTTRILTLTQHIQQAKNAFFISTI